MVLVITMQLKRVNKSAYKRYAKYHYLKSSPMLVKATYEAWVDGVAVGCLVICYPFPRCRGRHGKLKELNVSVGQSKQMASTNRQVERIARIVVLPKYRRHGMARQMIRKYLNRSKTKYVEVVSMPKLKNLFLSCGMAVTEYINAKNDKMIHCWSSRSTDRRRTAHTFPPTEFSSAEGDMDNRFIYFEHHRYIYGKQWRQRK